MSQQYPYPPQQPYLPPQPPRRPSWFARHTVLTVIAGSVGGLIAIMVILGIAFGDGGGKGSAGTVAVAPDKSKAKPTDKTSKKTKPKPAAKPPTKSPSQADQFKAFVAKNGLPGEKQAVEHVTKVQGADEQNDILDTAEVHTDFTGGLMSPQQSQAKLIASAFADWKNSKNGLVSIYGKDGELMANGNY